jgi:hypothetical protein
MFIDCVIPAKAGIQLFPEVLDPGFRRGDDLLPISHMEKKILDKWSLCL